MRKNGATKLRRLLAGLLTLVMALAALPAFAGSLGGWEGVNVSVLYHDADGSLRLAPVVSIPEETGVEYGWWVTLPEAALDTTVSVQILHTDPAYTYWYAVPTNGLQLPWSADKNADSLDSMYVYHIGYSYANTPQTGDLRDYMKLYFSTQQPPFAYEELPGGAVMLPAEEGIGMIPGAELITPGWTGSASSGAASARITVEYVHVDGTLLDSQSKTLSPGVHDVWPESSRVGGLQLVGEYPVRVTVYPDGSTDTVSVMFRYENSYIAPAQADVVIYHLDELGYEIAPRRRMTLPVGEHVLEAPAGSETPGYELISEALMTVTVHADGSYSPSGRSLAFLYRMAEEETVESIVPVEPATPSPTGRTAQITARYVDRYGNEIAASQLLTLGNGTHVVSPDPYNIPAGYAIVPQTASHTVTVSNGRANVSAISFVFEADPQPSTGAAVYNVTVYYYDTYNNEISPRETRSFAPGRHWVQPNPLHTPAGYVLAGESGFYLTVGADGSLDRAAEDVGFWYSRQQAQPQSVTVNVLYMNDVGQTIAGPIPQTLASGQRHEIRPDASVVPAAYDVSSLEPVVVTVSASGQASPESVIFEAALRRDTESFPAGTPIQRYGVVNATSVNLRSSPTTRGNTYMREIPGNGKVYMIASEYNQAGELWTRVIYNGQEGYVMTRYLAVLTQAASDEYGASVGATPVPTLTPAPTTEPEEGFVVLLTPPPATAAPYTGYAVLSGAADLLGAVGYSNWTLAHLPADTLVYVEASVQNGADGESWSHVRTLDNQSGYVRSSALRQIGQDEANLRIERWMQQNAAPAPTQEPMQLQGLGRVTANPASLYRSASTQDRIVDILPYDTVVYIHEQIYVGDVVWHRVDVADEDGVSGYLPDASVRLMTEREETEYINTSRATPTPTLPPAAQPDQVSPFGYVTKNSVNFRADASIDAQKLGVLNTYAMATVLNSRVVSGQRWYMVSYNGRVGYIRGDCFHQMTVREYEEFRDSDRYYQGLRNNSGETQEQGSTVAPAPTSPGNQTVIGGSNADILPTHYTPPFQAVGTPEPIVTATPTLPAMPGYVTQGGRQPTATPTAAGGSGSMTPSSGASSGNANPLVWILVVLLLLITVSIAIAVMQHQRKKRQLAMKAAQRRAQQARNAAAGRAYARTSAAPVSRTGAYPSYGTGRTEPLFPPAETPETTGYTTTSYPPVAPTAGSGLERPYARHAGGSDAAAPAVSGRRRARRRTGGADKSDT